MSTRELLAVMSATILSGGRRCPDEAVRDAREILSEIDVQEQAAERIDFARSNGVTLDPDGFDTPEEIGAVLSASRR